MYRVDRNALCQSRLILRSASGKEESCSVRATIETKDGQVYFVNGPEGRWIVKEMESISHLNPEIDQQFRDEIKNELMQEAKMSMTVGLGVREEVYVNAENPHKFSCILKDKGINLEQWVWQKSGKMPDLSLFLAIAKALLQILEGLQKAEIFHLDIKPDNLTIQEINGGLLLSLIDFGTARYTEGLEEFKMLDATTPLFEHPACRVTARVDPRVEQARRKTALLEQLAYEKMYVVRPMFEDSRHAQGGSEKESEEGVVSKPEAEALPVEETRSVGTAVPTAMEKEVQHHEAKVMPIEPEREEDGSEKFYGAWADSFSAGVALLRLWAGGAIPTELERVRDEGMIPGIDPSTELGEAWLILFDQAYAAIGTAAFTTRYKALLEYYIRPQIISGLRARGSSLSLDPEALGGKLLRFFEGMLHPDPRVAFPISVLLSDPIFQATLAPASVVDVRTPLLTGEEAREPGALCERRVYLPFRDAAERERLLEAHTIRF